MKNHCHCNSDNCFEKNKCKIQCEIDCFCKSECKCNILCVACKIKNSINNICSKYKYVHGGLDDALTYVYCECEYCLKNYRSK